MPVYTFPISVTLTAASADEGRAVCGSIVDRIMDSFVCLESAEVGEATHASAPPAQDVGTRAIVVIGGNWYEMTAAGDLQGGPVNDDGTLDSLDDPDEVDELEANASDYADEVNAARAALAAGLPPGVHRLDDSPTACTVRAIRLGATLRKDDGGAWICTAPDGETFTGPERESAARAFLGQ